MKYLNNGPDPIFFHGAHQQFSNASQASVESVADLPDSTKRLIDECFAIVRRTKSSANSTFSLEDYIRVENLAGELDGKLCLSSPTPTDSVSANQQIQTIPQTGIPTTNPACNGHLSVDNVYWNHTPANNSSTSTSLALFENAPVTEEHDDTAYIANNYDTLEASTGDTSNEKFAASNVIDPYTFGNDNSVKLSSEKVHKDQHENDTLSKKANLKKKRGRQPESSSGEIKERSKKAAEWRRKAGKNGELAFEPIHNCLKLSLKLEEQHTIMLCETYKDTIDTLATQQNWDPAILVKIRYHTPTYKTLNSHLGCYSKTDNLNEKQRHVNKMHALKKGPRVPLLLLNDLLLELKKKYIAGYNSMIAELENDHEKLCNDLKHRRLISRALPCSADQDSASPTAEKGQKSTKDRKRSDGNAAGQTSRGAKGRITESGKVGKLASPKARLSQLASSDT